MHLSSGQLKCQSWLLIEGEAELGNYVGQRRNWVMRDRWKAYLKVVSFNRDPRNLCLSTTIA